MCDEVRLISQSVPQSVGNTLVMLSFILLTFSFTSLRANVIHNGDFQSGSLPPWRCDGCHCNTGDNYLAVTQRRANWAGPKQTLSPASFSSDQLQHQLNFSLQALQPLAGSWKLHVRAGTEEKYFALFHEDISSSDWTHWDVGVNIDNMVLGADNIEIYFEATPDTANFNLDNIILDKFDTGKLVTELSHDCEQCQTTPGETRPTRG